MLYAALPISDFLHVELILEEVSSGESELSKKYLEADKCLVVRGFR